LAGAAFTVSFAVFGIFGGVISDRFNRRNIICLSCVLWSLCTFFSGYIDSFPLMFVLRFFLGLFEAFFGPAAYSIISDFYHP
jgi:MFS family permease